MLTIRLAKASDPLSNDSPKRPKQLLTSSKPHSADGAEPASKTPQLKGPVANREGNNAVEPQKLSQSSAAKFEVSGVDIAGYKVIRRTGEKAHFCINCNFPIAIYGKLEPCLHAFCLTCAKAEKKCFLCGAEVSRISTVGRDDGLCICGAPGCLQCFTDRLGLVKHVRSAHQDLAQGTLHKLKAEAAQLTKGMTLTPGPKRPRTAEPSAKSREEPALSVANSAVVAPSPLPEPPGGAMPILGSSQPGGAHPHHVPVQVHDHSGERGQQSKLPQQQAGPFLDPRAHPMQGPPDYHQGHMGHAGMPGPGMGPMDMMGPMEGPGPVRPGLPWVGGMNHPYLDHRPPFHAGPFGQHGPRGSFRPGVPDESLYGWGMGNPGFGPGPGFGGGWRPPL